MFSEVAFQEKNVVLPQCSPNSNDHFDNGSNGFSTSY